MAKRNAATAAKRATLHCAALSNPPSIKTGHVRSLLPDDEALVLFAVADMASHVIALMRARIAGDASGARF